MTTKQISLKIFNLFNFNYLHLMYAIHLNMYYNSIRLYKEDYFQHYYNFSIYIPYQFVLVRV